MQLFDAHNHLQEPELAAFLPEILAHPPAAGMVVNGTAEDDWEAVARLAAAHPWIRPSYGVHPWRVDEVTPEWRERLAARLDAGGAVGEIGLDRGKTDQNFDRQLEVFRWQWAEAARRDRPVTVHCLRAWGPLRDELRAAARPGRGFLLHAYGGSVELAREFVVMGACLSFSGSFLAADRERKLAPFREVPLDRVLVETDAPAMPVPAELDQRPMEIEGQRMNHPANLVVAYEGLARLRGLPVGELAEIVAANYARFFES